MSTDSLLDSSDKVAVGEYPLAVGSFVGFKASNKARFGLYKSKSSGTTLLHGETDSMEYDGVTDETKDGASYCLAVADPNTKSVELIPVPLVSVSSISKSRKKHKGPKIKQMNVRNTAQRTTLGEIFGTKKAKKALSDYERNKIDVEMLENYESAIVENVQENTKNLPTQAERRAALSEDRLLPPYNLEASKPEDIYPVNGIIKNAEYDAIDVSDILSTHDGGSTKSRMAHLPHKSSTIVSEILERMFNSNFSPQELEEKLKIVYYASLLQAVYDNRRVSSKTSLMQKIGENVPEIVINGILKKFTAVKAGGVGKSKDRSYVIDPAHETLLLCYYLVLILTLSNFAIALPGLSQELSLKQSILVDILRSIGCGVKDAGKKDAEALGVPIGTKYAALTAPLRLPEVDRRGRR